jgi:hypothetical protein
MWLSRLNPLSAPARRFAVEAVSGTEAVFLGIESFGIAMSRLKA